MHLEVLLELHLLVHLVRVGMLVRLGLQELQFWWEVL
jgi:hypothetical protein